jgi:hypothetical protein
MTHSRAARPIPLALTALVALFSALAALAVSGGMHMAQAHGPGQTEHQMAPMTMPMTISVNSGALVPTPARPSPAPSQLRRASVSPTGLRR